MNRENLADLHAFVTVAREKNFTRAAAKLAISQSALSRTIGAMERRMGLLLLTRTTRSVALTEAGERLLAAIAPKLDEIDAEFEALNELRDRPVGRVRITSTALATSVYAWPKLEQLACDYPEIQLEIIDDYGLTNIVEGRYDLGIRLGDQVERDMVAVRISEDVAFGIVAAPTYLAHHSPPRVPKDLSTHSCINLWLPGRAAIMPWELRKGRREVHVRVNGQLVFNNADHIARAALAGLGLAYLPKRLAQSAVKAGQLSWVLEDWHPTFTGFHAYYSSRRKPSRAMHMVIEALKAR